MTRAAARSLRPPPATNQKRYGSAQRSGLAPSIQSMSQIRLPRLGELERLREIERDAGHAFADIAMPEIANDEPLSVLELERFVTAGRAWVATDTDDVPIAYLLSSVIDASAHIEQVSVIESARSRGIGAALIDHLSAIAVQEHRHWVTLTTFRDVPWNAPYYQRLGFEVIPPADWGSQLAELMMQERSRIAGDHPRVAMRRDTRHAGGPMQKQ